MKKLTTLFIITLGMVRATFAAPQETKADTLNEYTGTAFAKAFPVKMGGRSYLLALGQSDFYSFIPMEKAKELNIKEGHIYIICISCVIVLKSLRQLTIRHLNLKKAKT